MQNRQSLLATTLKIPIAGTLLDSRFPNTIHRAQSCRAGNTLNGAWAF